jgi:phosphoglycerol transferase
LAVVLVVGLLDQASPALMPDAQGRARLWRADGAFVASLEHQLPDNAMVFQLPVVDFPEHGTTVQMAAHDLIKEGYLHSTTLRWSAGGMRGRDGEWQWPASALPTRDLLRGVTAMGFSALMLDRYGYRRRGVAQLHELKALLGTPIATRGDRLVAWDLSAARTSLIGRASAHDQRALSRRLLDAPRLYLSTDVEPIVDRGGRHAICASGSLSLENPTRTRRRRELVIKFDAQSSAARRGYLTIHGHRTPISADRRVNHISVALRPGTTRVGIAVSTPGLRCASAPLDALPSVSARVRPIAT